MEARAHPCFGSDFDFARMSWFATLQRSQERYPHASKGLVDYSWLDEKNISIHLHTLHSISLREFMDCFDLVKGNMACTTAR